MNAFEVLEARGFVEQYTAKAPELLAGEPVSFYVGFDPTGPSMHVGHLLPVMAMAHLQRAGHRPIAVLGGGTAMVGDPSGKDEMRQLITEETIASNAASLREQIGRLLDLSDGAGQMVNNADWLLGLNYIGFLRDIGRHFSVNTMLNKASVQLRLEKGLSFIEFNYQLLQAYDFLELHRRHGCILQLGGNDQWGNITAGIDLIRRVTGAEAHGLTFPLLMTSDGRKMGKTAKGAVWLDADLLSPVDYFQYWLNVQDADVGKLLRMFTFLPLERIAELEALQGQEITAAKRALAYEQTKLIHGQAAADTASGTNISAGLEVHTVALPASVVDVLCATELCSSKGDARRQIKGGAIRLGQDRGVRVSDPNHVLDVDALTDGAVVVWKGKKRSVRVQPA
jgi:tyrosyl-tRNA synthetase